jgi:hypothetical protein
VTWTYTPDFTTARDRVRVLIGDDDSSDPIVSDEIIALYTTGAYAQSSDTSAAIEILYYMLKKFSRMATSISAGGTSVNWGARADAFRKTLDDLLDSVALGAAAVPYAGGISVADVIARESDSDRVTPYFDRESATLTDPARWGR